MCTFLKKFEIQQNSKLQIIEKQVFYGTSIEKITISHFISKICEEPFINCHNFQRIEFFQNSKLQEIGKNAFSYSSITSYFIAISAYTN